jgi:hypothetical protein
MRLLRCFVVVVAILLITPLVSGQSVAPKMSRVLYGPAGGCTTTARCKLLNAVAMNAAVGARTFTLNTEGLAKVEIQINFVRSAATAVILTCTASLDGGVTYASITSTSVSSGVGTATAYYDSFAVSGSTNFTLEYDVRTRDRLKCVVSATSGGARDNATVYAIGAVGQ